MTVYAGYGKMWPPEAIAENARLRAILNQLHKLFAHIEGINDERDSVPILLEARRILGEGK